MNTTKKALITAAGPQMRPLLETYALPTFERYADAQGYQVQVYDIEVDGGARRGEVAQRARWQKMSFIRDALDSNELVVWVDADILIRRDDEDIASHLAEEDFQAFVMQSVPDERRINPNTGVWVMRNTTDAYDFLDKLESIGPDGGPWSDQAAVCSALGWIMGDEGYRGAKPGYGSRFLPGTAWLPMGWNQPYMGSHRTERSNAKNYIDRPYVENPQAIHFMAMEMDERELTMRAVSLQMAQR